MTENATKKDKPLNVYQRLQKARVELQKMNIKKSGKNEYAKFSYFELADFIPPVNEIFLNLGLSSNFSIEGNTATLCITNTDNLEEFVLFTSPIADAQLKGCTPIQSIGAVHTYMKRYLFLNALEITAEDYIDKNVGNLKPEKSENKEDRYDPKIVLFNKLKNAGLTHEQMNEFCQARNITSSNITSIQNFFSKANVDDEIRKFKTEFEDHFNTLMKKHCVKKLCRNK